MHINQCFAAQKWLYLLSPVTCWSSGGSMCIVKKYDMELKRYFVSNHCVATLKESSLIDMCLFSGEGKPTLLGGYVLSKREAFDLGKGLVNTSAFLEKASKEDKERIVNNNIATAYRILLDINKEQAEKLKEIFKIEIIPKEETKVAHGYIG